MYICITIFVKVFLNIRIIEPIESCSLLVAKVKSLLIHNGSKKYHFYLNFSIFCLVIIILINIVFCVSRMFFSPHKSCLNGILKVKTS